MSLSSCAEVASTIELDVDLEHGIISNSKFKILTEKPDILEAESMSR
jgi:hypothetical protein